MHDTAMTQAPARADLHAPTVLVVEDEALVRMPVAEYLRDYGYHVLEAKDAGEAIDLVDGDDPVDVVFSDVRMPSDIDGFDLARWIGDHHPNLPVLLTSGYSMPRDTSSNRVNLIAKPYSQAQVLDRIQALIQR